MDPVTLAAAVVVLVANSAATAVGTQLGTSVVKGLAHIRDLLRRRFADDPAAEKALTAAEQSPQDTSSLEQLQGVVQRYVTEDAGLAAQLHQLVTEAQAAGLVPNQTVIQAGTIKAYFASAVTVQGNMNIS